MDAPAVPAGLLPATYWPRLDASGNVLSASGRLAGRLGAQADCLTVERDGRHFAVAFPRGLAKWNGASRTLEFKGRTYALGDEIVLGGGFSDVTVGATEISGLSSNCPAGGVWMAG